MESGRASRTAVFVCQGRAAAHGRLAPARFDDPVAGRLLRRDELVPVEQVRAGTPPQGARERMAYEAVRACAEVVAPRTVAIDEAVVAAGHPQVVLVGAGLDARPWRLASLADCTVYAVDHPASQADLRERAAGLTPVAGRLELVPVDLTRESLADALARTPHDPATATTWVWEGVVPYLTTREVEATVTAIAGRSAPGSTLVVNYQAPSWRAGLGRHVARMLGRLTRASDPLADEPWRSLWSPEKMGHLLAGAGFSVARDEDLRTVAERVGSPGRRGSLRTGRVAVAGSP